MQENGTWNFYIIKFWRNINMPSANKNIVTITSGESLSTALNIRGIIITGVMVDGWTSADMTFKGSIDGTNYYPVLSQDGSEIVVTPVVNCWNSFEDYVALSQFNYIKIQSGTRSVATTQGSNRTITIITNE